MAKEPRRPEHQDWDRRGQPELAKPVESMGRGVERPNVDIEVCRSRTGIKLEHVQFHVGHVTRCQCAEDWCRA